MTAPNIAFLGTESMLILHRRNLGSRDYGYWLLMCRSAAQALGIQPIELLLDASRAAPAPAPSLTGLPAALNDAGSLVNRTVTGIQHNLQSAAAGLNLTVSQVETPSQ